MIIIEGPDCSGKSTLGKLLEQEFETPLLHMGAPKEEPDFVAVERLISRHGSQILVDRMCIGDFAYRKIWPRPHPTSVHDLHRWVAFVRATRSIVVACDAPNQILRGRFHMRGDEFLDFDKIVAAADEYRLLWPRLEPALPVLHYRSDLMSARGFILRHRDRFSAAMTARAAQSTIPFEPTHASTADSLLFIDFERGFA